MQVRFALLVFLLALAGCAPASTPGTIRDLQVLPQDVLAYMDKDKLDQPLLSPERQKQLAQDYARQWSAVWEPTLKAPSRQAVQKRFDELAAQPGYGPNVNLLTNAVVAKWTNLAALESYPSANETAITTCNTNLRALPTNWPRLDDPDKAGSGFPFDTLQESALWVGTPLRVWHRTSDRAWVFVSSPCGDGWVAAGDLADVSPESRRGMTDQTLAAIIHDGSALYEKDSGEFISRVYIGSVFPAVMQHHTQMFVLIATGGPTHTLATAASTVPVGGAFMPLPMTPRNVARIANQMLGQPYGWGGAYELRDCSSTMRDIMTPFGIFLPRNSAAQAAAYRSVDLSSMSGEEKERRVLKDGKPFLTLLTFPGHIGLYIGQRDGRVIMLHNFWGIRTLVNGVEGRHVIGRCSITTLQPGMELPEHDPVKADLRSKLQSMTFLGER